MRGPKQQRAYTLLELLVVMAVIVVMAGLLIVFWPGLSGSMAPQRNADKVQAMLLIARTRAIRDSRPTGVRMVLSKPTDPYSPSRQLCYVQQPDDFAPQNAPLTSIAAGGAQSKLTFANVDFTGGLTLPTDYLVQAGDHLILQDGGYAWPIVFVDQQALTVAGNVVVQTPLLTWRVVRQMRPLAGEEPLDLSGSCVIDMGISPLLSLNLPIRGLVTDGTSPPVYFREIIFTPAGQVMNPTSAGASDKILLWIWDASLSDPKKGEPVLVGVQVNTGFISAYPVDTSSSDPYSNTHDPHAGGM